MEYLFPDYYKKFKCIADQCPDTCCAGWQIMIDKKSLNKYKKIEGAFGNRVRNSILWDEECFDQYHKKCAFLNDENLCDLYLEKGESYLCKTCKNYPRHIEEYEGRREVSLSLSCPEAARIILQNKERVHFFKVEKNHKEEMDQDFDYLLFTKLEDARDLMIAILQDRNLKIKTRMAMVLGFAHDLQARINREEYFSIDQLIFRYEHADSRLFSKIDQVKNDFRRHFKKLLGLLKQMEVLREDWPVYIKNFSETISLMSEEDYRSRKEKFNNDAKIDVIKEQLLIYFIFTYFCGAVYDHHAYSKVKMAVLSTLLICEMYFSLCASENENANDRKLIEAAYRYSREIEHSDDNLNKIDKILSQNSDFKLDHILEMI